MTISTPVAVVIVLLLLAASLASYMISQWSASQGGRGVVTGIALAGGATALLIAAALLILSVRPSLFPFPDLGGALTPLAASSRNDRQQPPNTTAQLPTTELVPSTARTQSREARTISALAREYAAERASEMPALAAAVSRSPRSSSNPLLGDSSGQPASTIQPPWAATDCVHAFQRDPENLTRWTLENDCQTPVGIVFAACDAAPLACDSHGSRAWKYDASGLVLPLRAQRTVTEAEETRYGGQIRFIACNVTKRAALALIGQDVKAQTSPEWIRNYETAREHDQCLAQVRNWSNVGGSSGISVDALLGPGLPGRVRRSAP